MAPADGRDGKAGALGLLTEAGHRRLGTAEAELLQRMLDLGADVNEVSPRTGTPLEIVVDLFNFSDDTLQPFYDVLLARPDLDLLAPGQGGRPVLVNLRKAYARRVALVERAEALLIGRGLALPEPER